ncbi:MAG: hypothetical protein P8K68_04325 [Algibacter sp.]|uniref:hypothetical protein n=1 Tax=Algibacter sp. TaxID=1872428 RepID=UPI002603E847|nr:hypothetical protein [Algibacter sp.]MDG1729611.1 hypothetical protein [Algibacter sp.]MDG2178001.1 hypothetical protein [Algibacter sp.]
MKHILIVLALFFCSQTYAQEINIIDAKLPALISLKYPNIKEALTSKNNLNKDSFLLPETNGYLNTNFFIDNSRRANRHFAWSQSEQRNLSKELLKIMHRFPGDGSNLTISPRGLLVP